MNAVRSHVNKGLAKAFVFSFTRVFMVWAGLRYRALPQSGESMTSKTEGLLSTPAL